MAVLVKGATVDAHALVERFRDELLLVERRLYFSWHLAVSLCGLSRAVCGPLSIRII